MYAEETVENLWPQTATLSWNLSWEYDDNVPALSESVRSTNEIKTSEEFCLSSAAFFLLKDVSAVEEYKVQRSLKIGELTHFEWKQGSFLKDKTTSYGWAYHSVLIALPSRFEVKLRKGEHSQPKRNMTYVIFSNYLLGLILYC